ncbi:Pentatricopeptide repeat-containing protein [Nymphaea thermarum]|nr:Pentatricopeptide repeat-containing protein [Nymphaea thermarum]
MCCISKALAQGKQVHQQIVVNGFHGNSRLRMKLVGFYAACDEVRSAEHLFDEMHEKDIFSWTFMLGCYLRKSMYEEVIVTYWRVRDKGVYPDHYVFPKVLKACTLLSDLEEGVRVHNDMKHLDLRPNVYSSNSLIELYSKCGDVVSARRMFDEMPQRDVLSWNSMIAGYVSNSMYDSALELFNLMRIDRAIPDLITWNTVLAAYSQRGLLEEALDILNQIKECGYTMPNHVTWTTLIVGHARRGCYRKALELFKEMLDANVSPDADSLSCVISACKNLHAFSSGREAHGYGIRTCLDHKFYTSAGGALVTLYSACGRIADAANVFSKMDGRDIVSWNSMIMGLIQSGFHDSALKLLHDMQLKGLKPDQFTITALLQISSDEVSLKVVKEIHAYVVKNEFDLATAVWNALVHMYARFGNVSWAHVIFSSIRKKDVISWNAIIGGYGRNGHGRLALCVFKQMKESGQEPNHVTFTSVLSACSYSGLVYEGKECFRSMTNEYKFEPSMEQYACIVDLLSRSGHFEEAMDFINKMALEPDGSIWGSLLAGCKTHQNVRLAQVAAEQLFRLEPENTGNYVTLSNIYARAGRWDDAVSVRKMMEARGLIKPHGFSLVEAESQLPA